MCDLYYAGELYWLIDEIASYEPGRLIRSNPVNQEFQRWMLTVNPAWFKPG